MNFLSNATTQHVMAAYIAFQLYSAIIQSLPAPDTYPQGGIWYKAFYNFLSVLAADFKSIQTKLPGFTESSTVLTQSPAGASVTTTSVSGTTSTVS